MKPNVAKKQHFVPRFILNRFSKNQQSKNKKIYVYDKWEARFFLNTVGNVGCKNGCYNFEGHSGPVSLEPYLQQLDGWASNIISKIVRAKRLDIISQNEHHALGLFLAVQLSRTQHYKDTLDRFTKELFDIAEKKSGKRIINGEPEPTSNDEQSFFVSQVARAAKTFSGPILDKIWWLAKAPKSQYFYISDNPVVMHNFKDMGPYGNLGLMCPEIEIYMPLSKSLILCMFCPTFGEKFEQALATLKNQKILKLLTPKFEAHMVYLQGLIKAMKGGPASVCSSENVEYMNHLQVTWSRRYVYAPMSEFKLVRRMLDDNPKYKHGLTFTIS